MVSECSQQQQGGALEDPSLLSCPEPSAALASAGGAGSEVDPSAHSVGEDVFRCKSPNISLNGVFMESTTLELVGLIAR